MKCLLYLLIKISVYAVFILGENRVSNLNETQSLRRGKRGLVFPLGGTFKIVLGVGTPIKLSKTQTIAVGWNFQWQYSLAVNTSVVKTYPPILSRQTREDADVSRNEIYSALETFLNGKSLDLKDCLLRFVCEEAFSSFSHESNGVYGQLLQILLSPSADTDNEVDQIYLDAQEAGKFGADCRSLYTNCEESILNEGIFGYQYT